MTAAVPDGPLAAIGRQFPGWHAWTSSAGRLWATRMTGRTRPAHAPPEWALTVDGDDEAALRKALQEQEAGAPPGLSPESPRSTALARSPPRRAPR